MRTEQEQLSLAVYALSKTGFRYGMHVFITGYDDLSRTLGTLAGHCGAASITYGKLNKETETPEETAGIHYFEYDRDDIETAKEFTDKRLYDIVFETTGNAIAYNAFIDMVKRGGVVGILARLEQSHTFFVKTAVRSQIRFVGLKSYDEHSADVAKALIEQNWRGLE